MHVARAARAWTGAPGNSSVASAISAITRVICAPSTVAGIGGLTWRDVGESCDVSAAA